MLSRYPDIMAMIGTGEDEALSQSLRRAETIGRPIGAADFLAKLEAEAGRVLALAKRGRKAKAEISALSP
ncbi:MAG: IS200-like transposase [Caulobacter sp.]|nr:IS200-like transposase [Caulobacter sp.]